MGNEGVKRKRMMRVMMLHTQKEKEIVIRRKKRINDKGRCGRSRSISLRDSVVCHYNTLYLSKFTMQCSP
ncbi:hypothetical protein VNO77_25641 [Canavalia gladiata]|uniref:Uncharacterized protein n=1 Tax=Canavalia gladiata TaxID=3824 RepID=A0AAN9LAZ3_CANGL